MKQVAVVGLLLGCWALQAEAGDVTKLCYVELFNGERVMAEYYFPPDIAPTEQDQQIRSRGYYRSDGVTRMEIRKVVECALLGEAFADKEAARAALETPR